MKFEPSSALRGSVGDVSSVNVFTGTWGPGAAHFAAVLLGQGPLGVEGLIRHPSAESLACSLLIGMQLSPTFYEGRDSLCFSYWPMYPQLGQCQPLLLAHPGRKGKVDV